MSESADRPYFAYGSNMNSEQSLIRCPDSELVGSARLSGCRFIINSRGKATVVPSEHGVVHGVLWRISASDEATLDEREGVSYGTYRKEYPRVEIGEEESLEALAYYAKDSAPGVPAEDYIERLIRGAERNGLPASYIEELKSWKRK